MRRFFFVGPGAEDGSAGPRSSSDEEDASSSSRARLGVLLAAIVDNGAVTSNVRMLAIVSR